jgi:hypothetical protein
MASRKSFLGALWNGDIVGAAGALVAGVLHAIVMGIFLIVLGITSPILAVVVPFFAYDYRNVGELAAIYFFLGPFASAMFTFMVYCHVTRKERRAAEETFGEHCRKVMGYPTLCIICSAVAECIYFVMFRDWLWSDSHMAHAIFFALAPAAVFAPLWIYLIRRKRQKDAMADLHQRYVAMRRERDAEFLREQGIVN